jgi:acetyl esterase
MVAAMRRWLEQMQIRLGRPLLRGPSPLRRLVTARRPVVIDDGRLDPHLQHALFVMNRGSRPLHRMSLRRARALYDRMPLMFEDDPPPGVSGSELRLSGPAGPLPARVYRPGGLRRPPVLVYFHGGGGVVGSLDSHDGVCRRIAARAGCIVVHVAYRLAPEHPFPAAVHDAIEAFFEVTELAERLGGDPRRVGVGGDSMGGNLSAVVAQHCRDAGGRVPAVQMLVYPATDGRRQSPSLERFAEGFGLDEELQRWFRESYLAGADVFDPRVSPALAPDLGGLCPAVVATAGYDPLRDEGEAYAEALEAAGVEVRHLRFADLGHTFVQMTGVVPRAARALDEIADATRAVFERAC